MKAKQKKLFDAVQMVRDIRDAMYRQSTDPNFDPKEFDRIKEEWTKLLEKQESIKDVESAAKVKSSSRRWTSHKKVKKQLGLQ